MEAIAEKLASGDIQEILSIKNMVETIGGQFAAGVILFIVALIALLIVFLIFIPNFLSKFNKLVHGQRTVYAWIPVANMYLLGELAINKTCGIVLITCNFILNILGIGVLKLIFYIVLAGIFVYAEIKYNKLCKLAKLQNTAKE